MIDPRKLTIVADSLFNADVCPILDDEKAIELELGPVEQEALTITHKTREQLALYPPIERVWPTFEEYVKKYQGSRGGSWGAPVRAGFNIKNFDNPIVDRMCEKYGTFDKTWGTQSMFHPLHYIDLMDDFFRITENMKINSSHSLSLDNIREWLGMSKDGAHDAKNDVLDCAELVIRFLKVYRKMNTGFECNACDNNLKIKFEGALAEWKRPIV